MRRSLLLLLALCFALGVAPWAGPAAAQADPVDEPATAPGSAVAVPALATDERGWPRGEDPGVVADAAIAVWLAQAPTSLMELAGRPPDEVCAALPGLVANPPPPAGTRVRVEERLPVPREDEGRAAFTYAAVRSGELLDVVRVDLEAVDGTWQVERVGFRTEVVAGGRGWLQTPAASLGFVLLSVAVVALLLRPRSPLRRALGTAVGTIRRHRRTVIVTLVALYAVFVFGVFAGSTLPATCEEAVLTVVQNATAQLGAVEAYGSGDVARAAVVTFYQNFVVVTFSVHFLLSLLLGVPTYLLAVPQFFLLGLPFGLLGGTTLVALIPVVFLVAIELTAYFLVVSGGGIVLTTLFRQGFGAYPQAIRQAASLLVPAGLLLLAGAWYEAAVLILGGL